jgi:hypothetical protein
VALAFLFLLVAYCIFPMFVYLGISNSVSLHPRFCWWNLNVRLVCANLLCVGLLHLIISQFLWSNPRVWRLNPHVWWSHPHFSWSPAGAVHISITSARLGRSSGLATHGSAALRIYGGWGLQPINGGIWWALGVKNCNLWWLMMNGDHHR